MFLAGLAVAACGGAQTDAGSPGTGDGAGSARAPGQGGGAGSGGQRREHAGLTAEANAYHDVMAPLWHAEPGPHRTHDTCTRSGELVERARAIVAAPAPASAQPEQWQAGANALMTASEALAADCGAGAAQFDARFSAVHDAYHQLIRAH